MDVTTEQCADLLYDWMRSNLNSPAVKLMSRDVRYKYSIFSPGRGLRLLEEMTFMYASLAVCCAGRVLSPSAASSVIEAFKTHLSTKVLNVLAEGDSGFDARSSARLNSYAELLRIGGDAIAVAGDFLVNLFGTPDARLKFEAIAVATNVARSQASLVSALQRVNVLLPAASEGLAERTDSSRPAMPEHDPRILQEFEREIETWDPEQAVAALNLIRGTLTGDGASIEQNLYELTGEQLDVVVAVVKRIHGDDPEYD